MVAAIYFILGFVSFAVFAYAVQRKIDLRDRWFESTKTALREWSTEAARDAKAAVDAELVWTYVLIIAFVLGILFASLTVEAL